MTLLYTCRPAGAIFWRGISFLHRYRPYGAETLERTITKIRAIRVIRDNPRFRRTIDRIFTHPLTFPAFSDTVCPCHAETRFSTSAILRRYSHSHRINGVRYRLKRIKGRTTSSSPFSGERGDRTAVASWRQCKKTLKTTPSMQAPHSPLRDSGPVNSEAMPIKTALRSHYWWTKHGTLSKVTGSITGSV